MEWNTFWTAISAIGVAVSAIAAFMVTRISQTNLELSKKLLLETREMRLADSEAEVIIYVEPAEMQFNFLYLVLENVGPGVAYDVIVACKNIKELPDDNSSKIRLDEVYFLNNKIPLIAPKQKFQHLRILFSMDCLARLELTLLYLTFNIKILMGELKIKL